ncbi:MAG TPA: hypothetical protein VFS24_17340 [Steroidobacteraceae bacterium]|nr:hypothetical protein [Steroidobacteraceae bacterium]
MATFGTSSAQGGGTDNPSSNYVWIKATSTPASNGTLTAIHIWCSQILAGNIAAALYSDSGGVPDALIASNETGVAIPSSPGDASIAVSASITAGTQYWFGIRTHGLGGDAAIDFGSATGTELYFESSAGGNFPATVGTPGGSDASERWTVWGEYTPSGGGGTGIDPQLKSMRALAAIGRAANF